MRHADLHQPSRNLVDLSPYDHLHRLFRLCVVHIYRNIKACAVSEDVKDAMRSLVCFEHEDWNGTIEYIEDLGGVPGKSIFQTTTSLL